MTLHKRLEGKWKRIEKKEAFLAKEWESITRNNDRRFCLQATTLWRQRPSRPLWTKSYPYAGTHKSTWSDGVDEQVAT